MVKCKDGRKHVIVKEYEKKNGTEISSYERGCPTRESITANDLHLCCVCGEEYGFDDIHEIEIKGDIKRICKECVDTVHGLL